MLFKRRKPEQFFKRLRVALWPRRNWWRSGKYVAKRVLRLSATPHAIAAGVAAGVLASFTPFIGFHFVICFAVAYVIGGNLVASALGTFFGNPLTFPFIWFYTYKLGNLIMYGHEGSIGMRQLAHMIVSLSYSDLFQIIQPMLLGGTILGLTAAAIVYIPVRRLVYLYQKSRLARLARDAEARVVSRIKHLGEPQHEHKIGRD